MQGIFDEDEPEAEQPRRDTEMTLGAGALLGFLFGLVLLCGLCFGMGYATGRHRSTPPAAATSPTAAPDQEPLQANNAAPKPSAVEQTAVTSGGSSATPDTGALAPGANPATAQQSSGTSGQASGQGGLEPGKAQVQPALPGAGNTAPTAQGPTPNANAALPGQAQFMVQIAAVLNGEDADVLVSALRQRGYSVTSAREPVDRLIHVRIGPFPTRDEANRWANKLLGDGYNAVVQP